MIIHKAANNQYYICTNDKSQIIFGPFALKWKAEAELALIQGPEPKSKMEEFKDWYESND